MMNKKLLIFVLLVATGLAQEVFRITPERPIEELRKEALAAQPPQETGKRKPELVELTSLDATIKLDIRYATENNFLSTPVYEQARAFLQEPAAKALVKAHGWLKKRGYGLLIHDAYRPWYVTKIFWEATPPEHRSFVADPASGSRHNRGAAVDLTLYDLKTGAAVEMPSLYDEFSPRAHSTYTGGSQEQRRLRDLLRQAMEKHGFTVLENEWWHFDYKDWREYPVLNLSFIELPVRYRPGDVVYFTSLGRTLEQQALAVGGDVTRPIPIESSFATASAAVEDSPKPSGDPFADLKLLVPYEVELIIGPDGLVHAARFVEPGSPSQDTDTLQSMRQWRYKPAMKDGIPVAVRITAGLMVN